MPALLIYASLKDVPQLETVLKGLESLALLETSDGQHWRANRNFKLGGNGRWPFWCIAGGPLLRLPEDSLADPSEEIEDPYAGWVQGRGSKDDPYFGNQTNIIYLNLSTAPKTPGSGLGLSSLEWIGNYFWALGRNATSSAQAEWLRIRKTLIKTTTKVPRGGLESQDRRVAYAFPDALEILSGKGVTADTFPRR